MTSNARALLAEAVGTFALVTAVCGAGLFAASPVILLAQALAVGLSVLAMTYAVGHLSGGHFNPAVTLGLIAAGRFDSGRALTYILAQCAGGILAAAIFYLIASGSVGGRGNPFAAISNTYGGPGQFGMLSVFLLEVVVTALFLIVFVGATSRRAPTGFAPIAIGMAMTLFYIVAIPVSGGGLNPARSLSTALFGGILPISQLWVFWVAPILGAVIGGVIGRAIQEE